MSKDKPKYVLALGRIRIDRGDHHDELIRGDSCDDVPKGTLDQMVRLRQAVTPEEFEQLETTIEPEEEDDQPATDWKQTPIGKLGLSAGTFKVLNAAQLQTVEDVLKFGKEKGSLTELDGVGEATEKEVQEAIAKVAPAS